MTQSYTHIVLHSSYQTGLLLRIFVHNFRIILVGWQVQLRIYLIKLYVHINIRSNLNLEGFLRIRNTVMNSRTQYPKSDTD